MDGRLLYCHPPPFTDGLTFNATQQELTLRALEASGKKKAPITRVGKDASTFVASQFATPPVPGEGFAPTGQSAKSRALDVDFFRDGTGLSGDVFVSDSSRGNSGGASFTRMMAYPHQQAIGNDGRPIEGGVNMPIPIGKKHFKGTKHVKHRSGKGYD